MQGPTSGLWPDVPFSIRCSYLLLMINPHNDSAFYAYADWALAQEIAWDEEQQELEQLSQLEDSSDDWHNVQRLD